MDAFREALDEKLDLAEHVHGTLSGGAELEVPQRPDLSTVIFRVCPAAGTRAPPNGPMRRAAVCWSGSTATGASCSPARLSIAATPCASVWSPTAPNHALITEALKIIISGATRTSA